MNQKYLLALLGCCLACMSTGCRYVSSQLINDPYTNLIVRAGDLPEYSFAMVTAGGRGNCAGRTVAGTATPPYHKVTHNITNCATEQEAIDFYFDFTKRVWPEANYTDIGDPSNQLNADDELVRCERSIGTVVSVDDPNPKVKFDMTCEIVVRYDKLISIMWVMWDSKLTTQPDINKLVQLTAAREAEMKKMGQ